MPLHQGKGRVRQATVLREFNVKSFYVKFVVFLYVFSMFEMGRNEAKRAGRDGLFEQKVNGTCRFENIEKK